MACWQNGYAADCKSVYFGSIPKHAYESPGGENGRHKGLKIPRHLLYEFKSRPGYFVIVFLIK